MQRVEENEELFRVYALNNSTQNFVRTIVPRDLLDSTITMQHIEANNLTLNMSDREKFLELYNLSLNYTIVFERLIYSRDEMSENGGTTPESYYNEVFYGVKFTLSEDAEYNNAYTITAIDWKGFVEDRKIMSHNVFYSPADLPVDPDTGDYIFPDDFNKIKYSNNFVDQIKEIYMDNLINPYTFRKGIEPPRTGTSRKFVGYDDLALIVNGTLTAYNTLQEKKSILEYKTKFYETAFDNFNYNVLRVDNYIYYNGSDYSNSIVYNPQTTHIIDYEQSLDKIDAFTLDIDGTEYLNYAYVESDGDDFDFDAVSGRKTKDPSIFEYYGTSQNNDGDTSSIESNAIENLNASREMVTRTAEVFFNQKEYFRDIKIGDIVKFENFPTDLLNGRFIITQLTELMDGKTKTYSIDSMEFLEETTKEKE